MKKDHFLKQYNELRALYSPKHISKAVKNSKMLWDHILSQTQKFENISVAERIYIWYHNENPYCINNQKKKFNTLELGYRQFCGPKNTCECSRSHHSAKLKENWNQQDIAQRKIRFEKAKQTNLKKYGVGNVAQATSVKAKTTKTNLERHGAETPFQSPKIQEKIKASTREKYGVDYPFQSDVIREQSLTTVKQRYGGLMTHARTALYEKYQGNPFANKEVQSKIRTTMSSRYGKKHFKQSHLSDNVITTLETKNLFLEACSGFTIAESAVLLGVDEATISRAADKHDCRDCFAVSTRSKWEFIVTNWLEKQNLVQGKDFIRNTKSIIHPMELDFYFPNHNLALEVGSIFWHSEIKGNRDRNYHYRKWFLCKQKNINLLQYWDDELSSNLNLILNKLSYELNMSKFERIGGRQVSISSISTQQERDFLNINHVQGYTPDRSIVLGAFYKDLLVGVFCIANRKNAYEIVRFATHQDYNIRGLFSKFMKHVPEDKDVFSFSDNRHSSGKLYSSSGFTLDHEVKPVYFYTKDYHSKMHRRNFSKSALKKKGITIDDSLSEWENMKILGYDRIWDAGKIRWIKNKGD